MPARKLSIFQSIKTKSPNCRTNTLPPPKPKSCQAAVADYVDSDIPEALRHDKTAHPFYRNLREFFAAPDDYTGIIRHIVDLIKRRKVVDFTVKQEVRRAVVNDIEDYLFDEVDEKLSADTIEQIALTAWNLAVENKDLF